MASPTRTLLRVLRFVPLAPSVIASLLAVYLIWSSTFLVLRYMVAELPPLATSGVRFLIAGLALYAFLRVRGAAAPTAKQWLLSVVSGTLMFFVGNGFVAIAAREVPSGMTAMSIGSVPLFLSVMEAPFGQRPTAMQWLGIALGFAGVACMGWSEGSAAPGALALLFFAAIGWASASLIVRRAAMPAGLMAGATQLIGGGSTLVIGGLALGERFSGMPSWSAGLAFVYLVLFGSIVGFSAAVHLLRNAPASIATSYAYVNPVLAVVLGATLGGERIAPSALLAGLLVVAGVAVLMASEAREQRAVSSALAANSVQPARAERAAA
jgi:drug/metabolite transporter (DMT)-like permease